MSQRRKPRGDHDPAPGDGQRGSRTLGLGRVGALEWFHIGDREHVERALADMKALGIRRLRTGVSWADWHRGDSRAWFDWLFERLAGEVELLPCFLYTPPSLGVMPKSCSPPENAKAFADFLDVMITLYGAAFEWVELWNEPNNMSQWDATLDPNWTGFAAMAGGAAYWARKRGKKTLLGGMSPIDSNWLEMMFDRGVMQYIDAVGLHGFPGSFDTSWEGWTSNVSRVRAVLERRRSKAEVWITETGFSTWRHEERRQIREFLKALAAPVERIYWYSLWDVDPARPTVDGFHLDDREYHFGLRTAAGRRKLLYRLWEGGEEQLARYRFVARRAARARGERPALITGGAGFVGANLAHRLLGEGRRVLVYDNLSRPGVEKNLEFLRETHGSRVLFELADVRDRYALERAVKSCSEIFHLAAQVAVTTSIVSPAEDFEINALGTIRLLEAIRSCGERPPLVFDSTNKVYGALSALPLRESATRYEPEDVRTRDRGIDEARPLDFHSPYGCSKGAADQYVIDYGRTFEIPAVVLRMSCIYGPHQFGTEDQGWVAHFLIRTLEGRGLSIYGDGKQVRDILYVDDLVDAMLLAQRRMAHLTGNAYNIGGGPENAVSLLELLDMIGRLHGKRPRADFHQWRLGDQRYYVSNTSRFRAASGWSPRVSVPAGLARLYEWLRESRGLSRRAEAPAREHAGKRAGTGEARRPTGIPAAPGGPQAGGIGSGP